MSKPTDIDRQYGLEPVFEPGEESGNTDLEQFTEVPCPYCNEHILLRLDLTAGDQSYVEDCQVCCQPIQVSVEVKTDGRLRRVDAERMDR